MIISCPSCDSRFVVPDSALGEEGRKVRCAKCEHVWHQNPENMKIPEEQEPEIVEAESEGVEEEPIPQSVMPDTKEVTEEAPVPPAGSMVRGIAAGIIVFVLALALIIGLRSTFISSMPGTLAFYKMIGLGQNLPGEDLVFDQVAIDLLPVPEASGQDSQVYQVTGNIINLGAQKSPVPFIRAQFWNGDDEVGDPQVFELNVQSVAGEQTVNFSKIISVPENLQIQPSEVRLAFVLGEEH